MVNLIPEPKINISENQYPWTENQYPQSCLNELLLFVKNWAIFLNEVVMW